MKQNKLPFERMQHVNNTGKIYMLKINLLTNLFIKQYGYTNKSKTENHEHRLPK